MPRKNLIRSAEHPYHVTLRCNNCEWFSIPLDRVWSYSLDAMRTAWEKYPVNIQAFVLMANHYHLLIWTPNSDLDKFMFEFNRGLSKYLREATGRINRVFGDRYKWSIVKDASYYSRIIQYIYKNPVRASLVRRCEYYKYSTLYYIVKNEEFCIPIYSPFFGNLQSFLIWMNENNETIEDHKTQLALKRPVFRIPSQKTLERLKL